MKKFQIILFVNCRNHACNWNASGNFSTELKWNILYNTTVQIFDIFGKTVKLFDLYAERNVFIVDWILDIFDGNHEDALYFGFIEIYCYEDL